MTSGSSVRHGLSNTAAGPAHAVTPSAALTACALLVQPPHGRTTVVPSELAYGDTSRGKFITPGSVLLFEMEILAVNGASKPKPVRPAETAAPCASATPEESKAKRPKRHGMSVDKVAMR